MDLRIDPEFQALIPPLTPEEYSGLEASLISEGCRDALVVWDGIVVDGHNRFEICQREEIPFKVLEKCFEDREAVKVWIIKNQFNRRNLSPYQRGELALEMEGLFQEKAKEKQKESGGAVPQISSKPPIDTRKEVAKLAGLSHDTISKVKKIQQKATPEVKEQLRRGETTVNRAFRDIKKTESIKAFKEAPEMPKTLFNVILADPPWRYEFSASSNRKIENQYQTMELEEIAALAIPAANDCHLFLWATSPKLPEALKVMGAWGFAYKTCMVWVKDKIGMGYYARQRHEILLIGTRGTPGVPDPANRPNSVIEAARGRHSEKPDKVYEAIEDMFPEAKRLEMFSRKGRPGWEPWGNEVE